MRAAAGAGRFAALALCLQALPTIADDDVERYIDVSAYFVDPDTKRNTDDRGVGFRTALGIHWRGNWFWEIQAFGSVIETGVPAGSDHYLSGLGIDLVYAAGGKQGLSPFVLIGGGVDYNDVLPDENDDPSGFLNAALGITTADLNRHGLRLRAEVRYFQDFFRNDRGDVQFGLGLSVPFGRSRERVVERTVVREVPVEVPVEKEPEPPPDTDEDGIADALDACPNTLPAASVDASGCMLAAQTITLQGVNFEFDSAVLTSYAEFTLQSVARALQDQADIEIEIAGHTDSRGSDTYNLNLSRARAQSVQEFLIRYGVAPGRMEAVGYGESEPVASNDSDAGRAENRRVELRIKNRN